NNNTISKKLFKQIASAVGIYVHSDYPQLYTSQYYSCRNSNVVDIFCNFLIKMEEQFSNLLNCNFPLTMTDEDWQKYQLETHCYYCNQPLGYDKVKDHDHYCGRYRGAAHNSCNLNETKNCLFQYFFTISVITILTYLLKN
uniref:endonuclease domain-containing protein n=1 Tax=Bartonella sp. CL48QHWL TaxID=3243535 RepID=UPI0035CF2072